MEAGRSGKGSIKIKHQQDRKTTTVKRRGERERQIEEAGDLLQHGIRAPKCTVASNSPSGWLRFRWREPVRNWADGDYKFVLIVTDHTIWDISGRISDSMGIQIWAAI